MQTSTGTAWSRVETTVQFRAFVQGVSNCLTAVGLPKTNDIGQINPTTVNAPTTWNQIRGYEIRRFQDTLSSTSPIFLKIEYGSGDYQNGNSDYALLAQLRVSIGTGSNGSGTLTAPFSITSFATSPLGAGDGGLIDALHVGPAGEAMPIFASGGEGQVSLSTGIGVACPAIFFSIDRGRNNNGQPVADSVTMVYFDDPSDGYPSQITYNLDGTAQATIGATRVQMPFWGEMVVPNTTTRRFVPFDGKTGVLEIKPYLEGYQNPMTSVVGVTTWWNGVAYEEFDTFLYGSEMKFKSMPFFYGMAPGLINPQIVAMRWE